MAGKIGPFAWGSKYAEDKQSQALKQEAALQNERMAMWRQFYGPGMEALQGMATETPDFTNQMKRNAWNRGVEALDAGLARISNQAALRGVSDGSQVGNMRAAALAGFGRDMAGVNLETDMWADERERNLWAQIMGLAQAEQPDFGGVADAWGQRAAAADPWKQLTGLAQTAGYFIRPRQRQAPQATVNYAGPGYGMPTYGPPYPGGSVGQPHLQNDASMPWNGMR